VTFDRLVRNAGTQPLSDINMTPLIDVLLVLVVIFILTAPLLVSTVQLNLPVTDGAQLNQPPKAIQVALDKAGRVYLDDILVSLEELQIRLQKTAQQTSQAEVQLSADESVSYGRVVEVMGVAQKAGLNRIGFVAKP
jgi:biopolymer transport protein TolR